MYGAIVHACSSRRDEPPVLRRGGDPADAWLAEVVAHCRRVVPSVTCAFGADPDDEIVVAITAPGIAVDDDPVRISALDLDEGYVPPAAPAVPGGVAEDPREWALACLEALAGRSCLCCRR